MTNPTLTDRPDLTAGAPVLALLEAFYADVTRDPLLARFFDGLDMPAHLARIASFWDTVVFDAGRYAGNVFEPHRQMPGLTAAHFTRWLAAFERTVDERHVGPGAERAKATAHRVAWMMQLRLRLVPEAPLPAPETTRASLVRRDALVPR
jgi:hemoglobin